MGQKVNPHGYRVGVIKDWDARWYADKKKFAGYLVEDKKIRDFIMKKTDDLIKEASKNSKKPIHPASLPGSGGGTPIHGGTHAESTARSRARLSF